jgi:hypothetical protein
MKHSLIIILTSFNFSIIGQNSTDLILYNPVNKFQFQSAKDSTVTLIDINQTNLNFQKDSTNQQTYYLSFLGCDETPSRIYFSYFNTIFYVNKSKGTKIAFEIAKTRLFEKFPNSTIIPQLITKSLKH